MLESDKGVFRPMPRNNARKPLKTAHSSRKSDRQKRAITALLDSSSLVAAASRAEIGESTLRRWLHEDEQFQTKLRQLREEALGQASLRLQQSASLAVERLFDLLASKDRIEPGRASLVRTAIDFAFRSGAYSDLAERIAALENAPPPQDTSDLEGNQTGQEETSDENADPWSKDTGPAQGETNQHEATQADP